MDSVPEQSESVTSEPESELEQRQSTTQIPASTSTSSCPSRRLSRKGSIFIAEAPYSDCLSGYVPEEPDDDVFEVDISSGNMGNQGLCSRSKKSVRRIIVVLLLVVGLVLGIVCGLVLKSEHNIHNEDSAYEGSTVRDTIERKGIWNDIRLPMSLVPLQYDIHIRTDLTNFTFNGSVEIFIKCVEKTDVLLLHSIQLEILPNSVLFYPEKLEKDLLHFKRAPWFHEKHQYLVIELMSPLAEGSLYKFHADFAAPLVYDTNAGYYRTPYETSTGKRWTAATLTAITLARRVFPCFDEPAFKANFSITLDHQASYVAIANMPLQSNTTLSGGWIRSTFLESVPISTYLVAWAISDFSYRETTTQNGVLMRVWAREDAIETVNYALQVSARVLDFYDEYFETKFPLPKLDSIAVPEFPFGGMENWGLISYGPPKFLYQEGVSSTKNKQYICKLVAHEIAHQWFGNLVTLMWWDDTWLNEGFASYVMNLGVDHAQPDWKMNEQFTVLIMHPAFEIDSLSTSRPISIPVETNDEINQQFDSISYRKGASIIRMCSYFLGEDTFRKGLKAYLVAFKYSNAVRDDLWKHLNQAAKEDGRLFIDVKEIMDTWTLQMGYPVVTVIREYGREDGNLHFRAEQERFLLNPQSNMTTSYGDMGYKWYVPLTYTTSKDTSLSNPFQEWLSPGHKLTVSASGVEELDWLLVNVEARGYYRVNYDRNNWQLLTQQLFENHKILGVLSRSTLISDAFNLARAGLLDQGIALNLTQYLASEQEYVPWATAKDVMGYIGRMLQRTRAFGDYQKYMLHLATPLYEYVEWAVPETHMKRHAQSLAATLACSFGNVHCVSEATRQFSEWMQNPSSNPINPDVKASVYCTAINEGGQDEWFFAFGQFQKTNSDTEKRLLQEALACTQEQWLLQTYLSNILDDKYVLHDRTIINGVAENPIGTSMAWNFFWANWDYFRKTYGDEVFDFTGMVEGITASRNTEYELKQLISLMNEHPDQGTGRRAFQQAVESIQANIRWMDNNYEQIADWLHSQVLNLRL